VAALFHPSSFTLEKRKGYLGKFGLNVLDEEWDKYFKIVQVLLSKEQEVCLQKLLLIGVLV
jgi:hypothetical protein